MHPMPSITHIETHRKTCVRWQFKRRLICHQGRTSTTRLHNNVLIMSIHGRRLCLSWQTLRICCAGDDADSIQRYVTLPQSKTSTAQYNRTADSPSRLRTSLPAATVSNGFCTVMRDHTPLQCCRALEMCVHSRQNTHCDSELTYSACLHFITSFKRIIYRMVQKSWPALNCHNFLNFGLIKKADNKKDFIENRVALMNLPRLNVLREM